jgi:uncharacterized membrane protein
VKEEQVIFMMKSRKEWKMYAKRALSGNYPLVIAASLAVTAVNVLGGYVTEFFFPGDSTLSVILSEVFAFILTLLICVLSAGLYYMLMNIARGKEYKFSDLIYFFKNEPDRIIVASFVMAVIGWLTALPADVYSYAAEVPADIYEQMEYLEIYWILVVLGLVLNILLTIPFTLSYYLLADEQELGGIAALKESVRLMKGNIGKYLVLQLSFLPLYFGSVFTLGLALLWLVPYMEMTNVMFYRDIRGEFVPKET